MSDDEERSGEESEEETEEEEEEEEEEEKVNPEEAKRQAEAARKAEEAKRKKEEEERKKQAVLDREHAKEDEARRRIEERERKKAEVRKRLEESSQKKKNGFLTGARKKKLKAFLMKKIREDMLAEIQRKEEQKKRALAERVQPLPNMEALNAGQLEALCNKLLAQIAKVEGDRFDLMNNIHDNDAHIMDMQYAVNDLRGKFIKPPLKKISKYDNKFAKMKQLQKKGASNFREGLKSTGKDKYALEAEEDPDKAKPDWAAKH